MKTLKEFLEQNELNISHAQRFDLGYKVARLWDKQKRGKKIYKLEDEFNVRVYPNEFLVHEETITLIVGYITYKNYKL